MKNKGVYNALGLMILVVTTLFLIPFGSAGDSLKVYNSTAKEVTIKDSTTSAELMRVQLIENTYECSESCYAIIKITTPTDITLPNLYNNNFSFEFDDVVFKAPKTITHDFEVSTKREIVSQLYSTICEYDDKNVSKNCVNTYEDKVVYDFKPIDYKGYVIKAGTTYLKLNGKKKWYESVDWIPTFKGIRVEEWAKWSTVSSMCNYTFDNGASLGDNTGMNDCRTVSPTNWVSKTSGCIDGNCLDPSTNGFASSDFNTSTATGGWCFWFYPLVSTAEQVDSACFLVHDGGGAVPGDFSIGYSGCNGYADNGAITQQLNKASGTSSISTQMTNFSKNTWWHFCGKVNATGHYLYVNGVLNASTTDGAGVIRFYGANRTSYYFGQDANTEPNGYIDEAKFFNVDLSDAQIANMYATEFGGSAVTLISLLSPEDKSFIGSQVNLTVNSTYSSPSGGNFRNVTFYIYNNTGLFNQTTINITGTYNTTTLQFYNFALGQNYSWTASSCMNTSTATICNTTAATRTFIRDFNFGLCNTTIATKVWNITFFDEATLAKINASVTSSTFYYWDEVQTSNKTYTMLSGTENPEYVFCINGTTTMNVIPTFVYKSTGYAQKTYAPGTLSLTSLVTNTSLSLLSTADGLYVTFQVMNTALQNIVGASLTATTTSGLVCSGTTDSAGTITCFVDPLLLHNINVSSTGYNSYTSSIYPTQSSYTVTLSGSTTASNITDYNRGITISLDPTSYLNNGTFYNFKLNLTSKYWNLDSFGFNVSSNGTYFYSNSSTLDYGGVVYRNFTTGQNSTIKISVFWVIGGNVSTQDYDYAILDGGDTAWSISNFFTDLKSYLSTGMFGLQTGFSLSLVVFFAIFIFVGVMSYKFGLTSPVAVSLMVFALVAIVENAGLIVLRDGWPVLTIIFGLLSLLLVVKEVTNY